MAQQQGVPENRERDKVPAGELDYDALLAHYRKLGISDEPMEPSPPREKKKRAPALVPSSVGGKFAKKRGGPSRRQSPAEEAPPSRAAAIAKKQPEETPPLTEGTAPVGQLSPEIKETEPVTRPREKKQGLSELFGRVKPTKSAKRPEAEPSPALEESLPGEVPVREQRQEIIQAEETEPAPVALSEPSREETPKKARQREKAAFAVGAFGVGKKEKAPKKEKPAFVKEKAPKAEKAALAPEKKEKLPIEPFALMEWAYAQLYYIGVQLMRLMNRVWRRLTKLAEWMSVALPRWFEEQRGRFLRVTTHISDMTLFPYRELARLTGRLSQNLREARKEKVSFVKRIGLWWQYLRSLSRPLNHIANFVAPIVGLTILAATLNYFRGINYALSVEYSGQHLGYIAQESVFYEAQQMVLDRMLSEEYQPPEDSQPRFHIVIADEEDLMDQDTLANRIMSISLNEVEEADGVYIEGAFLGALEDGNEILIYLDSLLDAYRTGMEHELVQFVKSISVRRGIYPTSSVRPLYRITQDMQSDQIRRVEHKVEEGQTLSTIAEQYNVPVDQLLEYNAILTERDHENLPPEDEDDEDEEPRIDPDSIPLITGERLTVSQVSMDLGVKVTRREVYEEDIPYGTTNIEDSRYYVGYAVTLSSGVNGVQEVTADVTYIDGERVEENRLGTPLVLREPVNAQVRVGTMAILTSLDPGSSGNNSYMWPVKGGKITVGLWGYWNHTGIDIAAPYGTEIRAARDGQVIYATNYSIWPYGKRVDISHSDGAMTRYAHCSSVFVSYGQYVHQGDLIALVGSTGNSTGNHCHFEIRINGTVMNPVNFVGSYWPGF